MIFTYIFARSPNYGLTNRVFGGNIYRQSTRLWKTNMGVFPSGQWGQTVNLLLSASVVRIHPRPPRTPVSNGYRSFYFICLAKGAARVDSNSIDPPNSPAGKKAPVRQRRPLPAAETGRSCWGCGQQDARAAQGTVQPLGAATRAPFLRGSRNPPTPTKKPQRIKIRCGFVLQYFFLLFLLRPPVRAAVLGCCFAQ